jgi:(2Fe-2S) ferredoxin
MARSTRSMATLPRGWVGAAWAVPFACIGVLVCPQGASAQIAGAQGVSAPTTHHASNGRTAAADPAPQPVITLERSECHGQCAEYRLAFYEDGQVVYDGVANVSKAGRWYARVPRESVESLVADFRRIGYDSLTAKYPPGLTASPVATVSLREGSKIKVVTHEQDSPFPPAALGALEDRIDAAVQSVDWVK